MKTIIILLLAAAAQAEIVPFPRDKAINADQLIEELVPLGLTCRILSTTTVRNCEYLPSGINLIESDETTVEVRKQAVEVTKDLTDAVEAKIAAHIAKPVVFKSKWEDAKKVINNPASTRDEKIDAVIKALEVP